jgi:Rha family phage regulatory protein
MNLITLNPIEYIAQAGDRLVTTSRKVAQAFGKRHGDVLRAYDRAEFSDEFNQRNFASVEFRDGKGERRRAIEMTKDGFLFLAMSFTGRRAAALKEAFINAFNAMAEYIRRQAASAWRVYDEAWREFRYDKDRASTCGRELRAWRDRRRLHRERLRELHPQMPLLLT